MLELVHISKQFEKQSQIKTLDDIHLHIQEGEFFSLLGPSGCGKSTLLRILAGLEKASSGEIRLRGERIDSWPAQKRPFNMVFQKYALFPHLSVAGNIAFGLQIKNLTRHEIDQRVHKILNLVGLEGFGNRLPETLSGGQAQRVAVARALVNEPQVLLLDEPLSALDEKLRGHLQNELRALHRELGLTFIYVTHDQQEALTLSDRIGILHQGRLEQVSSPRDIYEKPRTLFAAHFIGNMSHLRGQIVAISEDLATVRFADGTLIRGRLQQGFRLGMNVLACIRPEKLHLLEPGVLAEKDQNHLQGRLRSSLFKGSQTEAHVDLHSSGPLNILMREGRLPLAGSDVAVIFDPQDTHLFSEDES